MSGSRGRGGEGRGGEGRDKMGGDKTGETHNVTSMPCLKPTTAVDQFPLRTHGLALGPETAGVMKISIQFHSDTHAQCTFTTF